MGLLETVGSVCRTRFQDKVATPEGLLVQYENDASFAPPQTGLWARLSVQTGEIRLAGLGNPKVYRVDGFAEAALFAPIESGSDSLADLADATSDAFRSVGQGGVTFRSPHLEPMRRDERWWVLPVLCPFFADEVLLDV
jgi:Bacteriophage related domain of unknown function